MTTPELRAELASMAPSSIIELYEITTSARLHGADMVYRFSGTTNATFGLGVVYWNGYEYGPFPIEAEGFSYSGKGTLPRPTVRVGNVEGSISEILGQVNDFNPGNDLQGAEFRRIRTCARFLDHENFGGGQNPYGTPDPLSAMPEEVFYIDQKTLESRDVVEFALVARYDLAGIRAPKRQCLKTCGWTYKGEGCGYNGSAMFDRSDNPTTDPSKDQCSFSLKACRLRFGRNSELPFGGFPGIGNYSF